MFFSCLGTVFGVEGGDRWLGLLLVFCYYGSRVIKERKVGFILVFRRFLILGFSIIFF